MWDVAVGGRVPPRGPAKPGPWVVWDTKAAAGNVFATGEMHFSDTGPLSKLILAKPSPQFLEDFDAERTSQGSRPRPPSRRWGSSGPKARSPHSVLKEPVGGGAG